MKALNKTGVVLIILLIGMFIKTALMHNEMHEEYRTRKNLEYRIDCLYSDVRVFQDAIDKVYIRTYFYNEFRDRCDKLDAKFLALVNGNKSILTWRHTMCTNDDLKLTQGDLSASLNNINSNLKTTQLRIANFPNQPEERRFMLEVYRKDNNVFHVIQTGSIESIGLAVLNIENSICL